MAIPVSLRRLEGARVSWNCKAAYATMDGHRWPASESTAHESEGGMNGVGS
jgi:hypothetical protein